MQSEMHLLGIAVEQDASLLTTYYLLLTFLLLTTHLLGVVVEQDAAHVALVARGNLLEHLSP